MFYCNLCLQAGIQAFHVNPYDGHTLAETIKQTERITQWNVKNAYVDLGYRSHNYQGEATVNIVNHRHMKRPTRSARAWMKRRAAIEPIFGKLKSDSRMSRNFLKVEKAIRSMPFSAVAASI